MFPVPPIAKPGVKSLLQSTESLYKGVQGIQLRNLNKAMQFNDRNAEVLMRLREGRDPTEAPADDEMRIDSDNVQNHYHMEKEGLSALGKLVALGVLALGIAIPGGALIWKLPSIIAAVKGVKEVVKPPTESPATAPAEPPANAAPSINIGGKEYELRLGK
jgi:hypothetical protein